MNIQNIAFWIVILYFVFKVSIIAGEKIKANMPKIKEFITKMKGGIKKYGKR